MELINDLGTDLAFAFLVEKRYVQKIDSEEAIELIGRVTSLLESVPTRSVTAESRQAIERPPLPPPNRQHPHTGLAANWDPRTLIKTPPIRLIDSVSSPKLESIT